jgi:hypothetical protein
MRRLLGQRSLWEYSHFHGKRSVWHVCANREPGVCSFFRPDRFLTTSLSLTLFFENLACSHFSRVPATSRPPSTRHLDTRVGTSLLAKSSPADYVLASRAARFRGSMPDHDVLSCDYHTRILPPTLSLTSGSVLRDDEPRTWVNVHLGHNFNHHRDEPFQRRGIGFSPIASISEAASASLFVLSGLSVAP